MNVHDHITDWQHLPSSFLAGKRAIATTVEGTTIDGFLQSMTTKFSNGSGSMVQLFFGGVFQPVIISLNGGENQLCRAYDSIFKWNETQIPVSQILKLTAHKPLFGNKQPNRTGTHWIVFMKDDAK